MHPLRANNLIDRTLVDEIFYQIPEILEHHEHFLSQLQARLDNWQTGQNNIGDIFRETVSSFYILLYLLLFTFMVLNSLFQLYYLNCNFFFQILFPLFLKSAFKK